ncbi:MAG: response regulator transcription factor [Parasporobacterium sp.]|nr:response regulator transcription factor [Parasporobacterium sp.]
MYQIAICDDEIMTLDYIHSLLIGEFNRIKVNVTCDKYHNGKNLMNSLDEHFHYDAVFLDIDMPGIDGFEICKYVRSHAQGCLVIFISNKAELVFQSFEYQPFRFIRKCDLKKLTPQLIQSVHEEWCRNENHTLCISRSNGGDIYSIDIREINFIEAQRKQTDVVTDKEVLHVNISFTNIENKLKDYDFMKPHRSFLVNPKKIYLIKHSSVQLYGGIEVPISKKRAADFRKEYLDYIKQEVLQ